MKSKLSVVSSGGARVRAAQYVRMSTEHQKYSTENQAEIIDRYRKETDRQKLLVKKAALAQSRLLFVVNGLRRLLDDEHFVTLLRAEAMHTLPRPLAERLGMAGA